MKAKVKKGFATMPTELVQAIARRGGLAVSSNREHMARIGRIGGRTSYRNKIDKEVLQ